MQCFQGRIHRKQYLLISAFTFLVQSISFEYMSKIFNVIQLLSDTTLLTFIQKEGASITILYVVAFNLLFFAFVLALFLFISATIRRIHDIGYSGYFALLFLVPYLGLPVYIILLLHRGSGAKNKYGAVPKDNRTFLEYIANSNT